MRPKTQRSAEEEFETVDRQRRQERPAEEAFLRGLAALWLRGKHPSASTHATTYAVRMMKALPETKGFTEAHLSAAMDRLFSSGEVVTVEVRVRSKLRTPIIAAADAEAGKFGCRPVPPGREAA